MGGTRINIKMLSFFIVILLITFGLGYSVQSFFHEEIMPSVRVNSDINFGNAPLNVSFSYDLFSFDGEIKRCEWDFNDGTKANDTKTVHKFYREGIFNVTLTLWDENGEELKDSIEIHVIEYYKPFVSINANNTYGKAPLAVQFTAESFDVDGNEFIYNWDFDDATSSEKKNPTHTFLETGMYRVRLTITDSDGQHDSDTIQIIVVKNHPPTAYANASTLSGGPPLKVEFEGSHTDVDGDEVTYLWYFEHSLLKANRESTEQNPTHTFYSPGVYLVRLTVEDEDGAIDTDVVQVTVTENWFSDLKARLLEFSFTRLIQRFIPDFLAQFILKFLG